MCIRDSSQGYAEGRRKGEEEAFATTRQAAQDSVKAVQQFLTLASNMRDEKIDKLSGEVLDVAVAVAEKVIHVSLKSSEEIIKRMIISATEKMKRDVYKRQMMTRVLNRTSGGSSITYTDVPYTHWAYRYIQLSSSYV